MNPHSKHAALFSACPSVPGRERRHAFSGAIYTGRNVVERRVGWLKQNGRLGTRHEKLAVHDLAMVKLAFFSRYLRLLEPSDTT